MSTYTDSLGFEEITPGDQAGLWGNTTNNNLALIDQAISGVQPLSFAGVGGTTITLVATDGSLTSTARSAVLNITGNATANNTVIVPNKQKTYLVRNFTGRGVNFRTASSVADYTVPAGFNTLIFCDGNNGVFTGILVPGATTLGVSGGGTGVTAFTAGFVKSSGGDANLTTQALIGVGGTANTDISGEVQVPNGGTGLSNVPTGSLLVGNGVLDMTVLAQGTSGQILTSNGAGANPSFQTPVASAVTSILAGTGISVSSPVGAVTISNTGPTLGSTNTWTGANTFNGGAAILGNTSGSAAAAGYVGELLTISSAAPVFLTSGNLATLATLSVSAGDWDIWGWMTTSSDQFTSCVYGVSTTTSFGASSSNYIAGGGTIGPVAGQAPMFPNRSATSFTIYLLINATFSSGSPTASGVIYARRVR
jgi:hypothetical protein